VKKQESEDQNCGDQIQVGNLQNVAGVAIGHDAMAVQANNSTVLQAQGDIHLTIQQPGFEWQIPSAPRLIGVPSRIRAGRFVGREPEIQDILTALNNKGVAVIWGSGKVGKSALAAEIANRQVEHYEAGVLWLPCEEIRTFDGLLIRVGQYCHRPQQVMAVNQADVREGLSQLGKCLLIWDSYEKVEHIEALTQFIQSLPASCHWLITSRHDPPKLNAPRVPLSELSPSQSRELLLSVFDQYGITSDENTLSHLIHLCAGYPLDLLDVAEQSRYRTLQAVRTDIESGHLGTSTELRKAALDDLGEKSSARQILECMSIFPLTFSEEHVRIITETTNPGKDLVELVRRGFLNFDRDTGRYKFHHEDIRTYIRQLFESRRSLRRIERMWADVLLEVGEDLTLRTPLYQWHQYLGVGGQYVAAFCAAMAANALLGENKYDGIAIGEELNARPVRWRILPFPHPVFHHPESVVLESSGADILRERGFRVCVCRFRKETDLIASLVKNHIIIITRGDLLPFRNGKWVGWRDMGLLYAYSSKIGGYGIISPYSSTGQPISWVHRQEFVKQWSNLGRTYIEVALPES
jgi:hypothetical protein